MKRRYSSNESDGHGSGSQDAVHNIRTKPPKIFDNITRRLMQLGVTLSITTFVGLIVRYAVQEFDPSMSTITVTTSQVNNRDIASLSVSKNFLERILEFTEESISIVATIIPIGFPLCTIFNRHFAKMRAGSNRFQIRNNKVLSMIPKYVVIGDAQACQMPNSTRLRPLVRDTIYQLIKSRLKPKLLVEDSYDEARKLGIRIGLIRRDHHRLAVIKSVDLLKNITDSRGDIKQGKVRYLLSRMKIMSQATPADKSLLIYLMKHCEPMPNENLAYLGYSFTDPEAMRIADCALTFQDCDDDDVKKDAQVILKSANMSFTDVYLFMIVCLLSSNIIQSYALYQISASVSCCLYRFLSITVFQEQLISHSQFTLLVIIQQLFAVIAVMTKWLASLAQAPLKTPVAEMSHAVTEDHHQAADVAAESIADSNKNRKSSKHHARSRSNASLSAKPGNGNWELKNGNHRELAASTSIQMHRVANKDFSSRSSSSSSSSDLEQGEETEMDDIGDESAENGKKQSDAMRHRYKRSNRSSESSQHIHLSGVDLDQAVIDSGLVTTYKQSFHNSELIDDVTYRLAKLHIAYQILVMIIIMIFGNAMFQLNMNNNRQHQTLAFNSLIMNNIFNLANCFNQFGAFNLRSGFKSHPFFVCVLLLAVFTQVSLTELNAFGLENLNPIQWFVCFVFALLSALIAPLTGQQNRRHSSTKPGDETETSGSFGGHPASATSRHKSLHNDGHKVHHHHGTPTTHGKARSSSKQRKSQVNTYF